MEHKISINGNVTLNVELGHTIEEWDDVYSNNENLWDIALEDFINGALEPNEDMLYWMIDGRLYETDIIIS